MSDDYTTPDLADQAAAEAEAQENARLARMMEEAIFGSGIIRLETEVFNLTGESSKVWLNIRWPDFDDEELITVRANAFLRGLAPEAVSMADANLARGRAVIEQLAVAPYPRWLQAALTDKKVKHRDGEELRPDTSRLKSRALAQALYLKYVELYNRFHSLSFS